MLPASITAAHLDRLTGLVVAEPDAATVTMSAPFTGEPIAALPQSSAADVERAFATARAAQRSWAATDVRDRAAIVLDFHDLVLRRRDEVLDLIQLENG